MEVNYIERIHPSNGDSLEIASSQPIDRFRNIASYSRIPVGFAIAANSLIVAGSRLNSHLYPHGRFWRTIAQRLFEQSFSSEDYSRYAIVYACAVSEAKSLRDSADKKDVEHLKNTCEHAAGLENDGEKSIRNKIRRILRRRTVAQKFEHIRFWVEVYFDDPRKIERIATIARELTETT